MIFDQIFNAINIGLLILDRDLKVQKWNRWMEMHSGIAESDIVGSYVLEKFPNLDNPKFRRSCKSVFSFGNFSFFSQKLNHYLFPFKSTSYFESFFEYMQQSCAMGPLRDENNVIQSIFIYVQDVTEVAMYEQKLEEMNIKDGLTGIFNRRFMDNKLEDEFRRGKRYGGDLSLIMIDIDFFKKVNDEHGHQCGDFILQAISTKISSLIRDVDYLSRFGGEEFCCLLPETDIRNACIVAERFRTAIMEQEHTFNSSRLKITVSMGVSELTDSVDSADMLIRMADEALYRAKREGRNRVVAAG